MISYPRWKIALVAVVLLIGIFLALPNLFGEENALQLARDRAVVTCPKESPAVRKGLSIGRQSDEQDCSCSCNGSRYGCRSLHLSADRSQRILREAEIPVLIAH